MCDIHSIMTTQNIYTEEIPTTWNSSSLNEAIRICDSVHEVNDPLPLIRKHFDHMVDRWFSDVQAASVANSTNLIIDDWQYLGSLAISWGHGAHYLVSVNTLHNTLVKKQRDYGHHNIARFGRPGLLIRVHDKIARLENLLRVATFAGPQNESIEDTVMDIAGYATIGMMWERGTFLLPVV